MAAAAPFIGAGAGAVSSLAGGFAKSRSLDAQAKSADYRAKGIALQGKQMAAERATDLNDVLSTIDGIRSQRNVSLDSPTAMVIERQRIRKNAEVSNAEQLGVGQDLTSSKYEASQYRAGKKFALISGVAGTVGSLASAFPAGG